MSTERQISTRDFLAHHHVFSLDEATRALNPPGGQLGMVERLKYYLETGRLKLIARKIYAVVPGGHSVEQFTPDPFLVAVAARPNAIFSHHSALELLGVAHSTWSLCTVFTATRRVPLALNGTKVRFIEHPKQFRDSGTHELGTKKVERLGRLLRTTGPERTLVEGFMRPDLVGGLSELVTSAGGLPTLDFDLLEEVLTRYDMRRLWAATGWFLEQHRQMFHVSDHYLDTLESHRPRSPQYLVRDQRGGPFVSRWNVVLPPGLTKEDPDAS